MRMLYEDEGMLCDEGTFIWQDFFEGMTQPATLCQQGQMQNNVMYHRYTYIYVIDKHGHSSHVYQVASEHQLDIMTIVRSKIWDATCILLSDYVMLLNGTLHNVLVLH